MSPRYDRDARKERFWRQIVQQWHRSGQTVRVFRWDHGLSEPNVYAWRQTIAERDAETFTIGYSNPAPPCAASTLVPQSPCDAAAATPVGLLSQSTDFGNAAADLCRLCNRWPRTSFAPVRSPRLL